MLAKALTSIVLASAISGSYGAVHEKRSGAPAGWTATAGGTADSTSMTLSIALTMQNIDQLESKLLSVSTPGESAYGAFLDKDDVDSLFGPSDAAVSNVTTWLKQNGVTNYNVDRAFIDFSTTVGKANNLLGASYQNYENGATTKLRTLSYSIPDDLQEHVSTVMPSTYFGKTQAYLAIPGPAASRTVHIEEAEAPTKRSVDAACQTSITPACLKELYNVGDYVPEPKAGSRIGFGSFLGQAAIYDDLYAYENEFDIPKQSFNVELFSGGVNNQSTDQYSEADLDVQNIIGVAHPLPVTEFITGGSPPFVPNIDQPNATENQNEPYVPYYRALLAKSNAELPQVISNSYGDEEDSVPESYAVLTCNLIGLMGLRGITILESSGDNGVGSGCLAPDYKTVEFNAAFPGTCPYVTAVGGTVNATPEVAWDGSQGGFSKYFPRPSFQDKAITYYLDTFVSAETQAYYGQYTNFKGRGFPDIAAHSVSPDYWVYYAGQKAPSGGTSAAAPVWAGIVGLLNDARLRAGKPALGWLNPLIYGAGIEGLIDITAGYSAGCTGESIQSGQPEPNGSGIVLGARWNATVGWDPTTGYGTPDFQKLKSIVLKY